MTIEKWLSDVYYDDWGTHIWNKVDKDGGSQLVADIRGWGRIQNEFKTEEEAVKFQDEVGKFIVQAIREKIAKLNQVPDVRNMVLSETEMSTKEIKEICKHVVNNTPIDATERELGYTIAMRHIFEILENREQLKKTLEL